MPFSRQISLAIETLLASAFLVTFVAAEEIQLHMATVNANSQPAILMTTFAEIASNNVENVQIEVYTDGIDTLDTMSLARGVLEMAMVSPVTHDLMTVAGAMYASETVAVELSKAVQLIMWFPRGTVHFAVRAESSIQTLDDITGSTVYLGPHIQSAAYYDAQSWIAATTGLIAGQDYEAVADTWDVGAEAFLSGGIDVFVSACLDPCPQLEALSKETDLRSIGPANAKNEQVEQFFEAGRSQASVLSELREGIRSGPTIASFQTVAGIAVYDATDDQSVYDITKAFWDNRDQIPSELPWIAQMDIDYAAHARGLIQFHPGAARYYKEVGEP